MGLIPFLSPISIVKQRCPVNCIRTQTTSAPTRSALSPTFLATSSTSPPNTLTVSPIRHLNFKLNSSERFQLSNLVTLPCVMTPQSPISLVMLKPVVANDPLMSFAGLDSLKTPFCHLLPNGSGQHFPLSSQTRLI